jgi:hypothetical protein
MLNRHNLNIATLCAKGESRFTLSAILVEKDRTLETDGYHLVSVTRPTYKVEGFPEVPGAPPLANGNQRSFLMPAESALAISKALPKKTTIPILSCAAPGVIDGANNTMPVVTTDLSSAQTHMVREQSGSFPDWKRVIPDPESQCYETTIDVVKLRALCDQFIAFGKNRSGTAPVTFRFHAHEKSRGLNGEETTRPVVFRMDMDGGDGQHMMVVLAPIEGEVPKLTREQAGLEAEQLEGSASSVPSAE